MLRLSSSPLLPRLGAILFGCVATMVGCQFVGDIVGVEFAEVGGGGGTGGSLGGAGGMGGAGGVEDPCPPLPAAPPDPGGPDTVDVVLAMRTINFGEADLGPLGTAKIGVDFDTTFTECEADDQGFPVPVANAELSCTPSPTAEPRAICDGDCGIDNAMMSVIGEGLNFLLTRGMGSPSDVLTEDICGGSWSLLIRIYAYDGTPNDDQVSVAVYPAAAPLNVEPCYMPNGTGGAGPGGCGANYAKWDGTDHWPVLRSAVANPNDAMQMCPPDEAAIKALDPLYVDHDAWVVDGQLVAELSAAQFIISAVDLIMPFTLSSGIITGRLSEDQGAWRLDDGVAAGRWEANEVFQTLSRSKIDGMPFCTDNFFYGPFKETVCNHRDSPTNSLPTIQPCDAISYAFALTAEEAHLGNLVDNPLLAPGCTMMNDPADDSCDE